MHMNQPLVKFKDLGFAYQDLLFDFGNAQIQPGEIVVLVGPSGAGKSTLMSLLRGEIEPSKGEVYISGALVETKKRRLVLDETRAGWVPQLDDLQSMLTLEENIAYNILRLDDRKRALRIESLKEAMHLSAFSKQKVRTLSGGQRQRVSIAKAMAGNPPVLLMDESLAQLDLRTKSSILLDLKAMVKRDQFSALLVLHDPADALLVADRLWVIQDGKLVQQGAPNDIISNPMNHEIAALFDYVNVVPAELDIPGPWIIEGTDKWIFAHDLPELDAEVIDVMDTPSGSITIYKFEGYRLIQK